MKKILTILFLAFIFTLSINLEAQQFNRPPLNPLRSDLGFLLNQHFNKQTYLHGSTTQDFVRDGSCTLVDLDEGTMLLEHYCVSNFDLSDVVIVSISTFNAWDLTDLESQDYFRWLDQLPQITFDSVPLLEFGLNIFPFIIGQNQNSQMAFYLDLSNNRFYSNDFQQQWWNWQGPNSTEQNGFFLNLWSPKDEFSVLNFLEDWFAGPLFNEGYDVGFLDGLAAIDIQNLEVLANTIRLTLTNGKVFNLTQQYDQVFNSGKNSVTISSTAVQEANTRIQTTLSNGQVINNSSVYSEIFQLGLEQSETDALALQRFIPSMLATIFGFFFQVMSINVLGFSLLSFFALLLSVWIIIIFYRVVIK